MLMLKPLQGFFVLDTLKQFPWVKSKESTPAPISCAAGAPSPEKAWRPIDVPKGHKPYGTVE
jgi:hypothetical protein